MQNLIKLWQNDKSRREFLQNYKKWRWTATIEAYDLSFWEYALPDGRTIIALEHDFNVFSHFTKLRSVIYYIRKKDKPFTPDRMSESTVANELKVLKVKLQKGEIL